MNFLFRLDSKIQIKDKRFKIEKKKQGLGCAIHMKEYTIMMYLTNQIPSFNNNEPLELIDNIS